jgi:hypothetical protein
MKTRRTVLITSIPGETVQVNCYELQYNQQSVLSNIVPQAQIKHDGPVLCSDISNVSMLGVDGSISSAVPVTLQFQPLILDGPCLRVGVRSFGSGGLAHPPRAVQFRPTGANSAVPMPSGTNRCCLQTHAVGLRCARRG